MTCQACALSIQKALLAVPGISAAEVNYGSRTAHVERDPELASGDEIRRAVTEAGYSVPDEIENATGDLKDQIAFAERSEQEALRRLHLNTILAFVLGGLAIITVRAGTNPWLPILLTTLGMVVAEVDFYRGYGQVTTYEKDGWRTKTVQHYAPLEQAKDHE